MADMEALGIVGSAAVAAPQREQQQSVRARVKAEMAKYMDCSLDFTRHQHPFGHDALQFWSSAAVKRDLPVLCVVAQVVLGHPASAAYIERDFGIASLMLTNKRSLLDVAWVDMMLFLRANINSIPTDLRRISALPTCARGPWYHERVPCRMRSAAEIRASLALTGAQPAAPAAGDDDDLARPAALDVDEDEL
jgi:hypothetical protein